MQAFYNISTPTLLSAVLPLVVVVFTIGLGHKNYYKNGLPFL